MRRPGRRFWRAVSAVALLGFVAVAVMVSRSTAFAALTKSKEAFTPHPVDARVRVEPGAERYGDALAPYLAEAQARVEGFFGRPFTEAPEVLVCATQESLNEFIAAAPGSPIRGTVLLGRVFIAPSAFLWEGRDTHRESLTHELAHLHQNQTLGPIARRRDVPVWLHEALADLVAGSGGEGITDEEAAQAILHGPTLVPDSAGALLHVKRPWDYGLTGPMLHKQSTLFTEYLRSTRPQAFAAFLTDLQDERSFSAPFRRHYGMGVSEAWEGFVASLGVTP